jgi:CheY-like chemotaxis protein
MTCDVTTRGSIALEMIAAASHRQPYDVGILDMQMPEMDGLQLAEAIKRVPANKDMKLVLMTSMAQRGHAARSAKAGIDGYLNKPVRQSQLYDCLRTVMGPRPDASSPVVPPTPKLVTEHTLREAAGMRRPRVLLAEDNRTNQLAAVGMLERLGYQVDVAVNGVDAVAACQKIEYGIVLMDKQMPEMDGLTATREIRKYEEAHGKPPVSIIALTADAMQGDREKCLAAGMNDYLSKPFKVAKLAELIELWGHSSPSAGPVPEAVAAVVAAPSGDEEDAIDPSVLDEFRGAGGSAGADRFVAKLIAQYLVEATSRMAAVKGAVDRRDAPALRLATHSLKGVSGTVGARKLAALSEELETLARSATFEGTPALVARLDDEFARVRHALIIEQGSVA